MQLNQNKQQRPNPNYAVDYCRYEVKNVDTDRQTLTLHNTMNNLNDKLKMEVYYYSSSFAKFFYACSNIIKT